LGHHAFLSEWETAYPAAHFIAPEGLAEKRALASKSDKSITNIIFGTIFTAKNKQAIKISEEFDREFEVEFLDGHMSKELAFYHKPDKTLIVADLLFNLPATEAFSRSGIDPTTGLATKLFAGMMNTKGSAIWQKRALWYGFASDRSGFNKSISRINGWNLENIVPAHGEIVLGGGQGIFQKVFAWHLAGIHKS
jgi:hypothetical protein